MLGNLFGKKSRKIEISMDGTFDQLLEKMFESEKKAKINGAIINYLLKTYSEKGLVKIPKEDFNKLINSEGGSIKNGQSNEKYIILRYFDTDEELKAYDFDKETEV